MSGRPYRHLGGEALRRHRQSADRDLDGHITRLRAQDAAFHNALNRAIALDDEAEARKAGR